MSPEPTTAGKAEGLCNRLTNQFQSSMGATERTQQPGSGALLLILIQVASRALTFIGNQFLLRFLSPSLLGIAVQLELVSVTSLYFARESLRVALQRQPPPSSTEKNVSSSPGKENVQGSETQTVVNLSYLAVFLGFVISTIFGFSYLQGAPVEVLSSPYFDVSFQIYAAATLVELLAEPAFVIIQQKSLYKVRARAETSAAMARCFSACLVALLGNRRSLAPSILPFAVGQAFYAIVLLALYFLPGIQLSRTEKFSLIPRPITLPSTEQTYYIKLFHKPILSLATTLYMQSIFKLLLTQGDALILSFLSSLADQGAFALASNYGGLLARLIFQPVEESSRNTFGRLISPQSSATSPDPAQLSQPSKQKTREALDYLTTTLHIYLLFSLPLLTFTPYILPILISHLLPQRWSTPATSSLLSAYVYYIPLMAVNGILDAFVTSVATPRQLRQQSVWMLLFTGVYGLVAWVMLSKLQMGATGLVGANMLNMALRVVWSAWFVGAWARENVEKGEKGELKRAVRAMLNDSMPSPPSIVVAGLVMLGLRLQQPGDGDLSNQFLGVFTTGIVLLGSTV